MPLLGTVASQFSGKSFGSYESISTTTVSNSTTSTVTFSSISSSYKSLQFRIFVSGTQSAGTSTFKMTTSAGTYSYHNLSGNGATVSASGFGGEAAIFPTLQINKSATYPNAWNIHTIDIIDYASTTKYKTFKGFSGYDVNGSGTINLWSGLSQSTSALSSISFITDASPYFASGSTFALYGIKG
jgi:hypothetical protein